MRLLIRCEASPAIGGGHAMRCLALAEAAHEAGCPVTFAASWQGDFLQDRCAKEGIKFVAAPEGDNGTWTRDLAERVGADRVIVDGPSLGKKLAPVVAAAGLRTMLIDDEGFRGDMPTLVLNPNIWATARDYPEMPKRLLLLGPMHVLLRRAFRQQVPRRKDSRPRRLLVTLGAADPVDFTGTLLRAILDERKFENLAIDVIVGPLNRHHSVLAEFAGSRPNLSLHLDPANLAELMAASDIAVSAAGGTLWELYYLGVPVLPVVIAASQQRNMEWLVAQGYARQVIRDPRDAVAKLADLLADAAWREFLAASCPKLIDGAGVRRALAALGAADKLLAAAVTA